MVKKIYQPRMELVSKFETKDVWQDWGIFDSESEAISVAKKLLEDIKTGKYNDRITDRAKSDGYVLSASVEVLDADSFDLLEIEEV